MRVQQTLRNPSACDSSMLKKWFATVLRAGLGMLFFVELCSAAQARHDAKGPLAPTNSVNLAKTGASERKSGSNHWAFPLPVRAQLPVLKQPNWPRTPVDSFVLARLEKEGLEPSAEADRITL